MNVSNSSNGYKNKGFDYLDIDQPTLEGILKGEFNELEEVIDISSSIPDKDKTHTIVTYEVHDKEMDDFYDVIDCIFVNKVEEIYHEPKTGPERLAEDTRDFLDMNF